MRMISSNQDDASKRAESLLLELQDTIAINGGSRRIGVAAAASLVVVDGAGGAAIDKARRAGAVVVAGKVEGGVGGVGGRVWVTGKGLVVEAVDGAKLRVQVGEAIALGKGALEDDGIGTRSVGSRSWRGSGESQKGEDGGCECELHLDGGLTVLLGEVMCVYENE